MYPVRMDWCHPKEYDHITVDEPADPGIPGILRFPGPALRVRLVPRDIASFARGWWPVTDVSYPDTVINGVPVLATSAEIDLTTADQLRAALLHLTRDRHPVVVVDMTGTRFCDCAGLRTLVAAYKRARAEGSELRVVVPAGGVVPRIFALTGTDRVVPCFAHLEEALAGTSCRADPQPVP